MYHAGLVCGLLMGILAGVLAVFLLFKKAILSMEFDERQERARGKAFQYGFFTLMIVLYVYGVSEMVLGRWCDTLTGVTLCVAAAVSVFAITCILKDAYLSLKEKPRQIMTLFTLIAVFNLGIGGIYLWSGDLVENGVLTFRATNPIVGLMVLLILVVYIVNFLLRDREEEE